jgi:hypothetical protein
MLMVLRESAMVERSLKKEVEEGYSTVNRRICDNASVVPADLLQQGESPLRVSRGRI